VPSAVVRQPEYVRQSVLDDEEQNGECPLRIERLFTSMGMFLLIHVST
jgi:hypothetical protein